MNNATQLIIHPFDEEPLAICIRLYSEDNSVVYSPSIHGIEGSNEAIQANLKRILKVPSLKASYDRTNGFNNIASYLATPTFKSINKPHARIDQEYEELLAKFVEKHEGLTQDSPLNVAHSVAKVLQNLGVDSPMKLKIKIE